MPHPERGLYYNAPLLDFPLFIGMVEKMQRLRARAER